MSVYVQKGNRGIMKETQENRNQTQNQQTGGYYGNRPNLTNKGPSKLRQQFGRGMTYFLVIAASIVFYFALLRLTNLSDVFAKII
ncbi:AI-2E family transporter, partial [Sporofaciens sp. SGI.106]